MSLKNLILSHRLLRNNPEVLAVRGSSKYSTFLQNKSGSGSLKSLYILMIGMLHALASLAYTEEISNYKSGISLNFVGERGSAFAEEYFYYDKVLDDKRVIYIRDTTPIEMFHNERNIAGRSDGVREYQSVEPGVGVIKYKVDGDQYRGPDVRRWTEFTPGLSFSKMNYDFYGNPETPVVGTTGPAGGELTDANRSSRYYRGILDSVGDEWHILTVADDDTGIGAHPEFSASDGKIWYFVVNPKTPCLTWRVVGSGQFYTTPPKKYFFPIIYDQTTYFTGTITCEIRDINGNNVFYRINGGSFVNAGSSSVTLSQEDFKEGENILEYYYAGNQAYTKKRAVVRNPGYPSAGEEHGDRLWLNAAVWEKEVKPRVNSDSRLTEWRNLFRSNNTWNSESWITRGSRTGRRITADTAFANAFTARWEGMNFRQSGYKHTAADLAKLALFDTRINLDPIGYEMFTWSNNPIPSREIIYRGYYDVLHVYDAAAAYDVLIGYYRADQGHANGITSIQDYFIRDVLAKWVHNAGMVQAGYTAAPLMWPTAHVTGAALIACMMPSYSTPYYGTSGLDGNTTVYPWTPFADENYTWKQMFLERNISPTAYPNFAYFATPEDMFTSDGLWLDRIPYTTTHLYGNCIAMQYNITRLFVPGLSYPNMDRAMAMAATGQLKGIKFSTASDYNSVYSAWINLQNSYFPSFRSEARPRMLSRSDTDNEGYRRQCMSSRPFHLIFYNHELAKHNAGSGIVKGPDTPSPSPSKVAVYPAGHAGYKESNRIQIPEKGVNVYERPSLESPPIGRQNPAARGVVVEAKEADGDVHGNEKLYFYRIEFEKPPSGWVLGSARPVMHLINGNNQTILSPGGQRSMGNPFSVGDQIRALNPVTLRESHDFGSRIITEIKRGWTGRVIEAPEEKNDLTIWAKVEFENKVTGWCLVGVFEAMKTAETD